MVKSALVSKEFLEKPMGRRELLIGGALVTAAAGGALAYLIFEAGKGNKKEMVLPPGTSIDNSYHFLYTNNWADEAVWKRWLIVTGAPEGPNKLSNSEGTTLNELFVRFSSELAVGQVWTGIDLKRNRFYLQEALKRSKDLPVSLLVFSAGALSLIDLPKEFYKKIVSLAIVSSVAGWGCLRGSVAQLTGRVFGMPATDDYLDNVVPFIADLKERGVPISVTLGKKDTILDSDFIASKFQDRLGITAVFEDRGHAPSPERLVQHFLAH